jgi:hypothetical protein
MLLNVHMSFQFRFESIEVLFQEADRCDRNSPSMPSASYLFLFTWDSSKVAYGSQADETIAESFMNWWTKSAGRRRVATVKPSPDMR